MERTKKKAMLPSNYVSLLQRREWWNQQHHHQHIDNRETQQQQAPPLGQQQQQVLIEQQQQHEEQLIKQYDDEDEGTESVNLSIKDNGAEGSATTEVGPGGSKKKMKKKKKKKRKEKEKVREVEVRENGEGNEAELGREERVVPRERHVWLACVAKGEKDNVALRRDWRRKRGTARVEFRPKVRDLKEGSGGGAGIELKLDNVVVESGQEVEVDSNVKDEKAVDIDVEEGGVVEESNLADHVDEGNDRSTRGNRVRGSLRLGRKGYGGDNRERRRSQGSFSRGNREYHGYNCDDTHRKVQNSGGNGRPRRGGDGKGSNGGMVWVKKDKAAFVGNVAEGRSSSL